MRSLSGVTGKTVGEGDCSSCWTSLRSRKVAAENLAGRILNMTIAHRNHTGTTFDTRTPESPASALDQSTSRVHPLLIFFHPCYRQHATERSKLACNESLHAVSHGLHHVRIEKSPALHTCKCPIYRVGSPFWHYSATQHYCAHTIGDCTHGGIEKPTFRIHLSTLLLLFSHTRRYCTRRPLALYIGTCSRTCSSQRLASVVSECRCTDYRLWEAGRCHAIQPPRVTLRCLLLLRCPTWKVIWTGGRDQGLGSRVVVTRSTPAYSVCS